MRQIFLAISLALFCTQTPPATAHTIAPGDLSFHATYHSHSEHCVTPYAALTCDGASKSMPFDGLAVGQTYLMNVRITARGRTLALETCVIGGMRCYWGLGALLWGSNWEAGHVSYGNDETIARFDFRPGQAQYAFSTYPYYGYARSAVFSMSPVVADPVPLIPNPLPLSALGLISGLVGLAAVGRRRAR